MELLFILQEREESSQHDLSEFLAIPERLTQMIREFRKKFDFGCRSMENSS